MTNDIEDNEQSGIDNKYKYEKENKVSNCLYVISFILCILAMIGSTLLLINQKIDLGICFLIWVIGFLTSSFFYALGEIISLLQKIVDKK